uniref:Uncharacterized protein n=1 Tax=Trichuris muris TaxID=70415 RepID=A0A5S6QI61_TRIMR
MIHGRPVPIIARGRGFGSLLIASLVSASLQCSSRVLRASATVVKPMESDRISSGGISFDEMLRKLPQMFQMANDMHNLTEYISQMRILFMLVTVLGIVGGLGFLLTVMRRRGRRGNCSGDRYHRCDAEDSVDSNASRHSDHWNQKQTPRRVEQPLGFATPPKMLKIPGMPENSV